MLHRPPARAFRVACDLRRVSRIERVQPLPLHHLAVATSALQRPLPPLPLLAPTQPEHLCALLSHRSALWSIGDRSEDTAGRGGEPDEGNDGAGLAMKHLRVALPSLVDESPDLGFYSSDIVLEDQINGVTLRGPTAVKVSCFMMFLFVFSAFNQTRFGLRFDLATVLPRSLIADKRVPLDM